MAKRPSAAAIRRIFRTMAAMPLDVTRDSDMNGDQARQTALRAVYGPN